MWLESLTSKTYIVFEKYFHYRMQLRITAFILNKTCFEVNLLRNKVVIVNVQRGSVIISDASVAIKPYFSQSSSFHNAYKAYRSNIYFIIKRRSITFIAWSMFWQVEFLRLFYNGKCSYIAN